MIFTNACIVTLIEIYFTYAPFDDLTLGKVIFLLIRISIYVTLPKINFPKSKLNGSLVFIIKVILLNYRPVCAICIPNIFLEVKIIICLN